MCDEVMDRYLTAGLSILSGALDAALLPGRVIAGASVLAVEYLPKLPWQRRIEPQARPQGQREAGPLAVPARLAIGKSLAKTISFRIVVTTLDFTTNYAVIGELAVAAGLSTFSLVAGPLFYFAHETVWNYYHGSSESSLAFPSLRSLEPNAKLARSGFTISRALAKTITYRTIATGMDFTTNYVVVGELAPAIGLSAFGFVVGPFIYLAHEKFWDSYDSSETRTRDRQPPTNRMRTIAQREAVEA